jgi:hypothetical protein
VSADFEARAARRRQTWKGGVARSFAEMEDLDLEFWLGATPGERIRAVREMAEDAMSSKEQNGSAERLQRSVGGVRDRRG